jgi:hypothetical protein
MIALVCPALHAILFHQHECTQEHCLNGNHHEEQDEGIWIEFVNSGEELAIYYKPGGEPVAVMDALVTKKWTPRGSTTIPGCSSSKR